VIDWAVSEGLEGSTKALAVRKAEIIDVNIVEVLDLLW
jgi:hypothetical protein